MKKKQPQISYDELAAEYKALFDAFLKKGFTTDQAFQLLLVLLSNES